MACIHEDVFPGASIDWTLLILYEKALACKIFSSSTYKRGDGRPAPSKLLLK